ncbi:MAG: nucleotidyltransferase domain-containing protein [Planctomycetota bacterium]
MTPDYDTSMAIADLPIWAPTPEKMQAAIERLVAAAQPTKIILFGSYARGEAGPDSDVDLLVVADVPEGVTFRTIAVREAIGDTPFPMDLIVVTPDEWEMWHPFVNTVMGQAFKYGSVLYERTATAASVG